MLRNTKRYAYSICDDESFQDGYDSIDEALECAMDEIKDNEGEYDEETIDVTIGEVLEFVPIVDADYVIERIQDKVEYDCCGCADGYLDDVKREDVKLLEEMLTKTFNEWAEKTNNKPNFYVVENCTTVVVSNDFPECTIGD